MKYITVFIILVGLLFSCNKKYEEFESEHENHFAINNNCVIKKKPNLESDSLKKYKFGCTIKAKKYVKIPKEPYGSDIWFKVEYDGFTGWLNSNDVISLPVDKINELSGEQSNKSTNINGKYILIKDPYKKQYFNFADKNKCTYVWNVCEGFPKSEVDFILYKNFIFFEQQEFILKIIDDQTLSIF